MSKVWHLFGALLVAASLMALASCGDSNDDDKLVTIAFTPIPTPTSPPVLCGNGTLEAFAGEECDLPDVSNCSGSETCVCCQCLGDGEGLGQRVFSIARPPSSFQSSALGSDVSGDVPAWTTGPILINAERPDPTLSGGAKCSANLSLAEDAIFGFPVLDGSTVCNKLFMDGSSGVIDCDGGSAQGVLLTIDSNGAGPNGVAVITTGLGDPGAAGPGAATIQVARLVSINIPSGDPATVCPTLDYDDPLSPEQVAQYGLEPPDVIDGPAAFSTTSATGIVMNPSGGGTIPPITAPGQNFACNRWQEENSVGKIIGPVPGLDNAIVGDTMNLFVLSDAPPQ